MTSDAHTGIKAAVKAILPGAAWQRCRVHFARSTTQHLGSARSKPVNALISTVFAQTTPQAATAQYKRVSASLRASMPAIADMMDAAESDLTAFAAMPRSHWQKIWSNNPIERLNRETKLALLVWGCRRGGGSGGVGRGVGVLGGHDGCR